MYNSLWVAGGPAGVAYKCLVVQIHRLSPLQGFGLKDPFPGSLIYQYFMAAVLSYKESFVMYVLITIFYAAAFLLMLANLLSIQRKRNWWKKNFTSELYEKFHTSLNVYEGLIACFTAVYLIFFFRDLMISAEESDHWNFMLCMILFWGAVYVRLSINVTGRLLNDLWKELNRTITNLADENRMFLDIIPGGVRSSIIKDNQIIIRHVNRRLTEITGYSHDEICYMENGSFLSLCYGAEDRIKLKNALDNVIENKNETSVEYRIRSSKGQIVWVSDNILPVRSSEGTYLLISTLVDISDRMESEQAIKSRLLRDSETDLMTGLLNKITFEKKAEAYINENQEGQAAFVLIDLDNFKYINDTFGHPCGDDALRKTARFLTDVLKKRGAVIGRIGGDEFMALLPGVRDSRQLKKIVKHLEETFVLNLVTPEGRQHTYTGSIGSCIMPCRGMDFQDYYRMVDSVLYDVKKEHKEKNRAGHEVKPDNL